MAIYPLAQFEADLAEMSREDQAAYAALEAPKTMVVRYGAQRMVGEFPYEGEAKPGCGSRVVVRTPRGTEIGEMLTSTCPNAGCSKSVSRREMLEYIERSGGRDYPFFTDGRVLRVATPEDMAQQAALDAQKAGMTMRARAIVDELGVAMKIVDAEPILGGERLTLYFLAEDRVDFRELVSRLAHEFHSRIELRQVGPRDEARLTADYERCGQHCCCRQFLKVLKPVSMKSAKTQKATLDPLKISGRCGRLMCCLRYEDSTYEELKRSLPRRKARVRTPDGWGFVLDTQILTQLVLVRLEDRDAEGAYPVEDVSWDKGDGTPFDGDDDPPPKRPGSGPSPPTPTTPTTPSNSPAPPGPRGGGAAPARRDDRSGGGRPPSPPSPSSPSPPFPAGGAERRGPGNGARGDGRSDRRGDDRGSGPSGTIGPERAGGQRRTPDDAAGGSSRRNTPDADPPGSGRPDERRDADDRTDGASDTRSTP